MPTTGVAAVLEQPWPPPGPGPQQPRDAHGLQWANDVRGALGRPVPAPSSGPDAEPWSESPGRQPAVRRRAADGVQQHGGPGREGRDHEGRDHEGRDHGEQDGPSPAPRDAGDRAARPLPARWVPQEEWIPDPTPAPEQRWSPEQDWLNAFAVRREVAAQDQDAVRASRRWWVVAGVAVPSLGTVVALVVALV